MRSILSTVLITLVLVVSPASAQKRNITEKDLFGFNWIADPQISPDGSRVAFVRVTVNDKQDGYNTSIWVVSTAQGEPHQLSSGIHDSAPRWSPDGKYLVFVRATEKDGRPEPPQLFMLPMAGGDSFQFTTLAHGATQPQWSPDGKLIAFVNDANLEDLEKAREKASTPANPAEAKKPDNKRESDVRVITRAVYRSNGPGYLDYSHPDHIWLITAPRNADEKVTPRQLTSGKFGEENVIWARDSSQIYFTADQTGEPYYDLPSTTVYSVAVAGGEPTKLTTFDMDAAGFTVSPNGKQFAFLAAIGSPVLSYRQTDLWVMDIAPNAKPHNLTESFDYDIPGGLTGDNRAQSQYLAFASYFENHRLTIFRFHRKLDAPRTNDIHAARRLSFHHQHDIGRVQRQMSHPMQFGQQGMRKVAEVPVAPQGATETTIGKHVAARHTHKTPARHDLGQQIVSGRVEMCRASRTVHTNCQTLERGQVKERRILNERTMGRGMGSVAGGAAELTEDGHTFNPDIRCARYPASGVCIGASSALVPNALPPLADRRELPGSGAALR